MEDFKNFKLDLECVDKDGNWSVKPITITVNTPIKLGTGIFAKHLSSIYQLSFSLKIPENIHSFLVGKTSYRKQGISNREERNYPEDFTKTLKSESIHMLTGLYQDLVNDYKWLQTVETAKLERVLFYQFETESREYNSDWNGDKLGEQNKIAFYYVEGYISDGKDKKLRYNSDKVYIGESNNKDFYYMDYVMWTKKRKIFFDGLQTSFETIIANINEFNKNLCEETVDIVFGNKTKLLG